MKGKIQKQQDIYDIGKRSNICVIGIPQGERWANNSIWQEIEYFHPNWKYQSVDWRSTTQSQTVWIQRKAQLGELLKNCWYPKTHTHKMENQPGEKWKIILKGATTLTTASQQKWSNLESNEKICNVLKENVST